MLQNVACFSALTVWLLKHITSFPTFELLSPIGKNASHPFAPLLSHGVGLLG